MGIVELEPEVETWLLGLPDEQFGQAERYIGLLAEQGVQCGEPFTRQLSGKRAMQNCIAEGHTAEAGG